MSESKTITSSNNYWPTSKELLYNDKNKSYEGEFLIPLWGDISNVYISIEYKKDFEPTQDSLVQYCEVVKTSLQWLASNKSKIIEAILEDGMFDMFLNTVADYFAYHSIEIFFDGPLNGDTSKYKIKVNGLAG